ncbi:sushi domain-containing protein 5 isoform X2 [Oxyura jamaicensis]|uniref:sushi domain-containing protein 5 isoform X2 n=1 Tax=Oxyura jamaicensis TaxID=8884 RepID=UPI0015A669B7|nr:sushi domain-containing protein 5 isoform X2 [Oxyura jamaicensis]
MQRRREKKTPQPLSCGWGLHSRAMASGSQRLSLTFVWGMGSVFFILPIISVRADGKVFALESKNNSQGLDLAEAEKACIDLNARLATAEELKRAVLDCSFTGCTMGWLADGSAGTIICRKTGSKQQSLKAIDVKIETDPFVNDQYDAFCVTDEDETEAHIDYEDNFPDDRLIRIVQNEHANDKEEIEQEQEQPSFSKNSEERRTVSTRGVTQDTDTSEKGSRVPTESPVSLLSQKKMFWFPLEAFSEPESEKETDDSTKVQFSEGDNHIGVKTVYDEPGAKIFYDSEDFPVGRILTTNDTKAEIDRVAITDESWLDGYPVTQQVVEDDEEEGDKVDGSMGTEEDIVLTTDQPNHVEVRKLGTGSPVPEEGLTQIVAATMRTDDEGAKETPVPPTSVSSLEDLSMSRGYDDAAWDHPTTSLETVTQEPSTMMLLDISSLKTSMSETSMMVSPFDHTTYEEAKGTTPYPTQVATMAPAPNIITDTSPQELAEQENLTQGFGENPVPTSEPCEGEDCPKSSKGAIIAVIVILLCLLLVAAVLAVCFFKKQQQKNSVYKLNGRCQPRHHCYHHYHHQHIEMQKV